MGKSTLLNALLPDVERETGAISQKLGRGRHTTREVTIFEAFGGRIADTPGKLSKTRYDSYCAMYDEVKDVKDWQRPKV